jgi:hypothetical protein
MFAREWFGLVVLVGCHPSSPPASFDAQNGADAQLDGPSGPAVTITVTKDSVPQPNVVVYFGDDDTLDPGIAHVTDAAGVATAFVETGLYNNPVVTAINPFGQLAGNTDELFTFEAVQPGDHLVLRRTTPTSISTTVTFPTDAGAATYRLHTSCGASDVTSGSTVVLHGCGAAADMLLETLDAGGASKNWLYQADVAVSDGGTVAFTGAYQPANTTQFGFDTYGDYFVVTPQIAIHMRLATTKGIVYDGPQVNMPISYMNHTPTIDLAAPAIPGATSITEALFGYTNYGEQHFVDWYQGGASHLFDLTTGGLPNFDSQPTFDHTTRYLGLADAGGGALPAQVVRARVELGRTGDRSWQWNLVAPYWSLNGSVRYPMLPTDVHDWNTATADSAHLVDATLLNVPGGYDGLRANAFSVELPADVIAGPIGRLYLETPMP